MRLPQAIVSALAGALIFAANAGAAVTVWAVGDGGDSGPNDDAVATRIESLGLDKFLYLGDIYGTDPVLSGSMENWTQDYNPSFGRFKAISSPTMGNHEWQRRAQGYDPYWGALAPQTNGGHWYSFDYAGWHWISLNTEESVAADSPQLAFLQSDLASRPDNCTIAFFHKPRYSAGGPSFPEATFVEPVFAALAGHAPAVLSGHDHNYQRFKPDRGIVQFVVGTGGHGLHTLDSADARLDASAETYGALRMTIDGAAVSYAFLDAAGATLDSGSFACSPAPPPPGPGDPTPPPAPGGEPLPPAPGGQNPAALDPELVITQPRAGRRYRRVGSAAGVVEHATTPVDVNLRRGRGRACAQWDGKRMRGGCKRLRWIRATRTGETWHLRFGRRGLAPGAYNMRARVRGASAFDVASFRVIRPA